jgi:hypothetical protein
MKEKCASRISVLSTQHQSEIADLLRPRKTMCVYCNPLKANRIGLSDILKLGLLFHTSPSLESQTRPTEPQIGKNDSFYISSN